jgi:hypothetical protein
MAPRDLIHRLLLYPVQLILQLVVAPLFAPASVKFQPHSTNRMPLGTGTEKRKKEEGGKRANNPPRTNSTSYLPRLVIEEHLCSFGGGDLVRYAVDEELLHGDVDG